MEDSGPPPVAQLLNLIMGCWNTQLVYVLAKLGIPDLLKGGPRSASELADATGTRADLLARVLRACTAIGVLGTEGDKYALSPMSELLQAVTILRNCREAMTGDSRLLIIEPIVSREPGFDYAKLEDITMMLFGGEDRTEAHLVRLAEAAGFRKGRFLSTEQSGSQCLEALPA